MNNPTNTQPLTAEQLRSIVRSSIAEHPRIVDVRPAGSFYSDRLGLLIVDTGGVEHRVHILTDARRAVA